MLLSLCSLDSTDYAIVKVIGTSLHKLETLYLDDLKDDSFDDIKCLVRGCPKLKILHVNEGVTLESVEYLLLGLPNLIEFKHPSMIVALEKIIQDGRADRVSALRNLHINDTSIREYGVTDALRSAQIVMKYLKNITKLHITVSPEPSEDSRTSFAQTVCAMSNLTELTWNESLYGDTVFPIIRDLGRQLTVLVLSGNTLYWLYLIDKCENLRVLHITDIGALVSNTYDQTYDDEDLEEEEDFTLFKHLQELNLSAINYDHFNPALFKSLLASPALKYLVLQCVPIFTDDIVKAVFSHVNQDGDQLAFTSLLQLELDNCDYITNYLETILTHDRVPLEVVNIEGCVKLTDTHVWNMEERFEMEFKDYGEENYVMEDDDD